jgi:type VI secretion system secreted protein VgrG
MAFTQANRHIAVTTPLGQDVLLLQGFSGQEGISQLFSFSLDLLSEVDPAIKFDDIVGKSVTIAVKHAGGTRHINGIVRRFSQGGGDPGMASYRAEVVPWLWLLTQTADCRIFQNKTVPDIISQIFRDLGFTDFRLNLVKTYQPREYCVQYRETDFNFVSRLMEQYGIFYFFEHANGKHTLVMADAPAAHQMCVAAPVRYQGAVGATITTEDVITELTKQQEIRPGKYSLTDYNFETPSTKLSVSVDSVFPGPPGAKLEVYDYPGEYPKRDQGDALAKLRIEEEESQRSVVQGSGGCRQFTAGYKFTLKGHARADVDASYTLVSVTHSAQEHGYGSEGHDGFSYANSFACIPAAVPFRTSRMTPKPFVQGTQTAEVVGSKGEEIYTDKYGRVKVQFHWDREGKKDENSSCWIRVSHPWAGKNWGSISIPRIGQEVIVDFLEGDPDQPIIIGRVYNAELMPPYTLPDHGTQSGTKSRSSKGGAPSNFNEIRLEDKKGSEQIFVHGEKDVDILIKQERRESIGASRHLTVAADRIESVGANQHLKVATDRFEEIGANQHLKVTGDRNEDVGMQHSLNVGTNLTAKAALNIVGQAGMQIYLKGGMSVVIEAGVDVTLKGPGGFVSVGPAGVTIQGIMVLINSGGSAGSGTAVDPKPPKAPKAPKKASDKPA